MLSMVDTVDPYYKMLQLIRVVPREIRRFCVYLMVKTLHLNLHIILSWLQALEIFAFMTKWENLTVLCKECYTLNPKFAFN